MKPVRYNIVRKKVTGPNSQVWLPVGTVSIFAGDNNKYHTGKVQLNIIGEELHLFHEDYNKERQADRPIQEEGE